MTNIFISESPNINEFTIAFYRFENGCSAPAK